MNGRELLVGSTGFVGQNLMKKRRFSQAVHSSDVANAYDTHPDLVVYAGVPSAMFLANADPEADLNIMREARMNLRKIGPAKIVLISTIAVYSDARGVDEETPIKAQGLSAYGANRFQFEEWVRSDFPDVLIVRLPALYGAGLKKNFIFDMIRVAPGMLKGAKYEELSAANPLVRESYELSGNGFWKLKKTADMAALREWFEHNDFNALDFTDSRSRFQFYDLGNLWDDVSGALAQEWTMLNIATPPVSAAEVFEYVNGRPWCNELPTDPFDYDMRSIHTKNANGSSGYRCTRDEELAAIKRFVEEAKQNGAI